MTTQLIDRVLAPYADRLAALEAYEDRDEPLPPGELAAAAGMSEDRRREFTTGRALAHGALTRLGRPSAEIPHEIAVGARGAPVWPPGFVGSITHCPGYRAAVAGRRALVEAIGIDAEPDQALPDRTIDVVAGPAERRALAELGARAPGLAWDRLMFSAKESAYKCWHPLTGEWLEYEQVEVSIDPGQGSFTAVVNGAEALSGRWVRQDGLLVTAVIRPAAPTEARLGPG